MTDQELRERMHKAMDTRLSGVQEDSFLAQRVMATTRRERPAMRLSLRTAAIVLALLLSTAGVVYAAVRGWLLKDYLSWIGGDVPENFITGFDQDISLEVDGISFRVREAYVSGDRVKVLTEISRTDGQPALFTPPRAVFDPDTRPACVLVKELVDVDETTTIRQYAAEKHLPLMYVEVHAGQQDSMLGGMADQWMENDSRLVYYTEVPCTIPVNGEVVVAWEVSVIHYDGADDLGVWNSKTATFTLRVDEAPKQNIPCGETVTVAGVPIVLDRVILQPSGLEIQMKLIYHMDSMRREDRDSLRPYRFKAVDPETLAFLPFVSDSAGPQMYEDEDNHRTYYFDTQTLGLDALDDTLCLQLLSVYTLEGAAQGTADAPTIVIPLDEMNRR